MYGEGSSEALDEIVKALQNGTYKGPRTITLPGPPQRTVDLDFNHPNYNATEYYPLKVGELPTRRPPDAPGATTPATWVPASGPYAPGYWQQTGASLFGEGPGIGSGSHNYYFILNPNGPGGGWVYSGYNPQ